MSFFKDFPGDSRYIFTSLRIDRRSLVTSNFEYPGNPSGVVLASLNAF